MLGGIAAFVQKLMNISRDLFESSDESEFVPNVDVNVTIDLTEQPRNPHNGTIVLDEDDDFIVDDEIPDHDTVDSEERLSEDDIFTTSDPAWEDQMPITIRTNSPRIPRARPAREVRLRPATSNNRQGSQNQRRRNALTSHGYILDSFAVASDEEDPFSIYNSDDRDSDTSEDRYIQESAPRRRRTRTSRNVPSTSNTRVSRGTSGSRGRNQANAQTSNYNYGRLLQIDDVGNDSDEDDGWLSSRYGNRNAPGPSRRNRTRANNSSSVISIRDEEMAQRQRQEQLDFELALSLANEMSQPTPSRLHELRELNPKRRKIGLDRKEPNDPDKPCSSNSLSSNQGTSSPSSKENHTSSNTQPEEIRCIICFNDDPTEPVACIHCQNLIGCKSCVNKWTRTTNISSLNRRSPLSRGISSANHRACPLCRAEWESTYPDVIPFEEMQQIRFNNR
uniref:RING-type domain-containing protein n=1 Tax=Acrobeloides nanus TaxID=290746 RepID=A0A914EAI5_9BILA